jgi:hypothetical protein
MEQTGIERGFTFAAGSVFCGDKIWRVDEVKRIHMNDYTVIGLLLIAAGLIIEQQNTLVRQHELLREVASDNIALRIQIHGMEVLENGD